MELQNPAAASQTVAQAPQQSAPPPAQTDGRATADVAAAAKDPRPEVPLPVPASSSQTGLVSKAALPDTEAAPKLDAAGVSAIQRTLKPYGINMLPEKQDAPNQETPTDVAGNPTIG